MTEPMWCDGCRATGAIHCAHPDQCGNMLSATAAADQWKSWLDDLPLPFTFDPAIGRLQDFITALTVRLDVPQPNTPDIMPRDEVQKLLDGATPELSCETFDLAGHIYGPGGNLIAETYGAIGGNAPQNTRLLTKAPDLARSLLAAHDEIDRVRAEADKWRGLAAANGGAALDNLADVVSLERERDRLAADNARLAAQVEALTGAGKDLRDALGDLLAAYSKPDDRLCCGGQDCGCQGATIYQQAEYYANAALAAYDDATLASMTDEERAGFEASMIVRDRAKKLTEGQTHWKDACRENNGPDICDEPCSRCAALAAQATAPDAAQTGE